MRDDMHKVIVERPRQGGEYYKPGREGARERLDLEHAPIKERMKRRGGTKTLNENLAPLYRFLLKSVGRSWDKVYSEISARIRRTSTVQNHVLQHVDGYVEKSAFLVDGMPHRIASYSGMEPLRKDDLYVCPKSGLLKIAKVPKQKKPRHPPPVAKRIGNFRCAVMIKGCWHEAEMKNYPFYVPPEKSYPMDAVLGYAVTGQLERFYGKSKGGVVQYAASIRPMIRDEIRRLPF